MARIARGWTWAHGQQRWAEGLGAAPRLPKASSERAAPAQHCRPQAQRRRARLGSHTDARAGM